MTSTITLESQSAYNLRRAAEIDALATRRNVSAVRIVRHATRLGYEVDDVHLSPTWGREIDGVQTKIVTIELYDPAERAECLVFFSLTRDLRSRNRTAVTAAGLRFNGPEQMRRALGARY